MWHAVVAMYMHHANSCVREIAGEPDWSGFGIGCCVSTQLLVCIHGVWGIRLVVK